MSAFSPFVLQSAVATAEPVRSNESRYGVNLEPVRALVTTGPANLLLWGDSTSSWQASTRLPLGIALSWKAPNGIAGWFLSVNQSSVGSLTNFAGTQFESTGQPIAGVNHAAGANCVVTDYADPNTFSSTEILTGVVSPLPKACRKYAFSGIPAFQAMQTARFCAMGTCQRGTVWAAGDWLTGKTGIRIGLVTCAHAAQVTNFMKIYTIEGDGNASGAAAATVLNALTMTTPATPAIVINWANIAAASINTPFGTVENSPGLNQNPLFMQYEGIGTVNPGDPQTAADIVAAGNANWTGAFRMQTYYDDNTITQAGKSVITYGMVVEDTANTNGLYVDNISFSGDTILTQVNGATAAQMGAALNMNTSRPINWVMMLIGENHTTAEWNGGSINAAQIRTDLLLRIARVNAGWDAAGLPRGLITLVSPPESVGGTKSGSAWYTTLAGIMRDIARSSTQISFIDFRQKLADRFATADVYSASRTNTHMNILSDGVHQSMRGCRLQGEMLWEEIMGSIAA